MRKGLVDVWVAGVGIRTARVKWPSPMWSKCMGRKTRGASNGIPFCALLRRSPQSLRGSGVATQGLSLSFSS